MQKFYIKGINCKACASYIEKTLKAEKDINSYQFSYLKKELEIDCSTETLKRLTKKLNKAGYYLVTDLSEIKKEKNYKLRNLILTICFFLPLFYLNMGHMLYLPIPSFLNLHEAPITNLSIQLTLVLIISSLNYEYFLNGFRNILKNANMDSLIALSASISVTYGIYSFIMFLTTKTETYLSNIYFESAGMILTFISIGKYIEDLAIRKATFALNEVKTEQNIKYEVKREKETLELEKTEIKANDELIIKSGTEIPADSIIIRGDGLIDQSSFTGEAKPIQKTINEEVLAGTFLKEGYLEIKVKKTYNDSKYSEVIKKAEDLAKSKLKIEKIVDKIAFYFVYFVILIAIITFILNITLTNNLNVSLNNAITVLVIACPCSLGIATPLAVTIASNIAYKQKILIKDINELEEASKVKAILFDKTGTLTNSELKVTKLNLDDKDYIYSLEQKSNHPIARSITNYLKNKDARLLDVQNYEELKGIGIKGSIEGREVVIANYKYLNQEKTNKLYLIIDNKIKSEIELTSEIKEGAKELVAKLNQKYDTYLITGDNEETAKRIASELNIKNVKAEILPEDKYEIIKNIKEKEKKKCLMIGDGVNDSLALLKADVSMSIKSGTDIAINSANVVLMNDKLSGIATFLNLANKTMLTIKVNLAIAFIYNLVAIILATGAFSYWNVTLNPMIASLIMSCSSLLVVLNSVLLYRLNKKEKIMEYKYKVNGMSCNHCKMSVEKKFSEMNIEAKVDLKKKTVTLNKELAESDVQKIIEDLGFKYAGKVK